jgi:hypothetical protein
MLRNTRDGVSRLNSVMNGFTFIVITDSHRCTRKKKKLLLALLPRFKCSNARPLHLFCVWRAMINPRDLSRLNPATLILNSFEDQNRGSHFMITILRSGTASDSFRQS